MTDLKGPASGVTMRVHVWLPPQYDDPAYADKQFPVLEVFPGGTGSDKGAVWLSFGVPQKLVQGAAAGKNSPFVLVAPQMQVTAKLETECTDLPGLPKVGTFLEQDVPDVVKKNFRVRSERTAWGVSGVSSGAYCGARVLTHRPDQFSVGGVLDAYFEIDSHLPAGQTKEAKATSPQVIAATNPPDVLLRNWYGNGFANGTISTYRSDHFAAVVKPPMRYEGVLVPGGGHLWEHYSRQMPDVFAFFTAHLDKVAP